MIYIFLRQKRQVLFISQVSFRTIGIVSWDTNQKWCLFYNRNTHCTALHCAVLFSQEDMFSCVIPPSVLLLVDGPLAVLSSLKLGGWWLVTGDWWLVTGDWWLVAVDCYMLTGYWYALIVKGFSDDWCLSCKTSYIFRLNFLSSKAQGSHRCSNQLLPHHPFVWLKCRPPIYILFILHKLYFVHVEQLDRNVSEILNSFKLYLTNIWIMTLWVYPNSKWKICP